jgi:hypothetical protein
MNNLPTAEEMASKWEYDNMNAMGTEKQGSKDLSIAAFMQEFAKLHCEAQLKAIIKNVTTKERKKIHKCSSGSEYSYTAVIDKKSIINAYNLNNIK